MQKKNFLIVSSVLLLFFVPLVSSALDISVSPDPVNSYMKITVKPSSSTISSSCFYGYMRVYGYKNNYLGSIYAGANKICTGTTTSYQPPSTWKGTNYLSIYDYATNLWVKKTFVVGTSPIILSCKETDKGIDYYNYGYLYGNLSNPNFGNTSDLCIGNKTLRESYCSGTTAMNTMYNCPYGCSKGACIQNPVCYYQENANSKLFNFAPGTAVKNGNTSYLVDGNWSSKYYNNPNWNGEGYYYFNYTQPSVFDKTKSKLYIKDITGSYQLVIPESCWAYNSNALSFRVYIHLYNCPIDSAMIDWQCYDGSNWNTIRNSKSQCGSFYTEIYEEAMVWNCDENYTICGNDVCDKGETLQNCPKDCYPSCTDSDGGKNYYVKGKIYGSFGKGTLTDYDYCTDNTTLGEYYCQDKTNVQVIYYGCPNGCKDGACLKPECTINSDCPEQTCACFPTINSTCKCPVYPTPKCVNGKCLYNQTTTCSEIGGMICDYDETCTSSFVSASDTDKCCPVRCIYNPPLNCEIQVKGDAWKVETLTNKLSLGERIADIKQTIGKNELQALSDRVFTNNKGSFGYTQEIKFGSGTNYVNWNTDAFKLRYTLDTDIEFVDDYLTSTNGENYANYSLKFTTPAKSDIVSGQLVDLKGKKINILGLEFNIENATLFGSTIQLTLAKTKNQTSTLGVEKIVLNDVYNSGTGSMFVNDVKIPDVKVTIKGSISSTTSLLNEIKLVYNSPDDVWIRAGNKLSDKIYKYRGSLINWDVAYEGLTTKSFEKISIVPSGNKNLQLKCTVADGDVILPLAYSANATSLKLGDLNHKLVLDTNGISIAKDDYFFLTDRTDDLGKTYALQYKGADSSTGDTTTTLQFKNMVTGELIEKSMTIAKGSMILSLGGKDYTVFNATSAAAGTDNFNIFVDGNKEGYIITKNKAKIIINSFGPISVNITEANPVNMMDNPSLYSNQWYLISAGSMIVLTKLGDAGATRYITDPYDANVQTAMTSYGALYTYTMSTIAPNKLEIDWPQKQRLGQAFVISGPIQTRMYCNENETETCTVKGNSCCKGDICSISANCLPGYTPVMKGCDANCLPMISCVLINQTCTDSDGGLNYNVKGFVKSSNDDLVYEDKCAYGQKGNPDTMNDTNILFEAYCFKDINKSSIFGYGYKDYKCPSGCKDGACLKQNTTCTNECPYNGYTTCSGNEALICSYYDSDGCLDLRSADYCEDGCYNGACIVNQTNTNCIDSDGGINYYKKGNLTLINKGITSTDWCEDSRFIRELYCGYSRDDNLFLGYESRFNCQYGCKDGACIKPAPTCTDSDGGKNYYTKGRIISNNNITYEDTCSEIEIGSNRISYGGPYLVEYYCGDNKNILMKNHQCENGCEDGVCLKYPRSIIFYDNLIYCLEGASNITYEDDDKWGYGEIGYKTRCVYNQTTKMNYFCSNKNLMINLFTCPSGCKDGACIKTPTYNLKCMSQYFTAWHTGSCSSSRCGSDSYVRCEKRSYWFNVQYREVCGKVYSTGCSASPSCGTNINLTKAVCYSIY